MKTLFVLLLLCSPAFADDWSRADVQREAVYLVLHTVDWGQTRQIAKNPDQFYEINPILGRHPSVGKVNTYFLLTGLAHVAISHALPSEWRKWWQYVSIVHDAGYVVHNYRLGIRVDFPYATR